MTCLHPGCAEPLRPYSGRGPRPRYCLEHSAPKWRKARERAGIDPRPECCRARGKGLCAQHRRPKRQTGIPVAAEAIRAPHYDPGDSRYDPRSADYAPSIPGRMQDAQITSPTKTTMPLRGPWMTEPYPVIGQCDLGSNGGPVNPLWRSQFGEPAARCPVHPGWLDTDRRGLVRRGPGWPWPKNEAPCLADAA